MITFARSEKKPNFYCVYTGSYTLHFDKREMGELKSALENAVDSHDRRATSSFVQLRRDGGVGLYDGRTGYCELSLPEIGELIRKIDEYLINQSRVDEEIRKMSS